MSQTTRLVGLIGGMSWQTTAVYYQTTNQHVCSRLGGVHSANLLIRSLDYATIAELVTSQDFEALNDLICKAGLELKTAGVQCLALCANVAHKAADALQNATGLPVLHIVDFTGEKIVEHNFHKVGLLATRTVMEEDFYKGRLRDRYGLQVVVPADSNFRAEADRQIFQEMSNPIIPDKVTKAWHEAAQRLVEDDGVECIVLGCTELRLVFGTETTKALGVPVFETTALHAKGIAEWALA